MATWVSASVPSISTGSVCACACVRMGTNGSVTACAGRLPVPSTWLTTGRCVRVRAVCVYGTTGRRGCLMAGHSCRRPWINQQVCVRACACVCVRVHGINGRG
jgi:hypothetical protein